MRKIHIIRSQQRRLVRFVAAAALVATLAAGYAGLRAGPALQSSMMHIAPQTQLADVCQSGIGHC
jgi:uncharacterized protein (DUF1810 family)